MHTACEICPNTYLCSTVSDASHPHYSWNPHQHISSLCKHNKSKGHHQDTFTTGGFHKRLHESLIHKGDGVRMRDRQDSSLCPGPKQNNKIETPAQTPKFGSLTRLCRRAAGPRHVLLTHFQSEQRCCDDAPSWRLCRVRVRDSVYENIECLR